MVFVHEIREPQVIFAPLCEFSSALLWACLWNLFPWATVYSLIKYNDSFVWFLLLLFFVGCVFFFFAYKGKSKKQMRWSYIINELNINPVGFLVSSLFEDLVCIT